MKLKYILVMTHCLFISTSAFAYETHLCFLDKRAKLNSETFELSLTETQNEDDLSIDNSEGILTKVEVVKTDDIGDFITTEIYFEDDEPYKSLAKEVFVHSNGSIMSLGNKGSDLLQVVISDFGATIRLTKLICKQIY